MVLSQCVFCTRQYYICMHSQNTHFRVQEIGSDIESYIESDIESDGSDWIRHRIRHWIKHSIKHWIRYWIKHTIRQNRIKINQIMSSLCHFVIFSVSLSSSFSFSLISFSLLSSVVASFFPHVPQNPIDLPILVKLFVY